MLDISLEELISTSFFEESKILAGEKGLKTKVTSVNMLDAPDGYKYMKKGALVITTAYSLLNDLEAQEFVLEKLAERKVAALGIKLRFFNNQLPDNMKKKADELGFPIISISNKYAYAEILDFLMNNIYFSKTKTFIRRDKIYNQLIKIGEKSGLEGIVKKLNEWTDLQVVVYFKQNKIEYPINFLPADFFDHSLKWERKILNVTGNELNECVYEYNHSIDGNNLRWLGVEFRDKRKFKNYMFVFKKDKPFDRNDVLLLDFAASAAKLEMERIASIEQERHNYKNHYLHLILEGLVESKEEASIRAKSLGWDLPQEAQVFYFMLTGSGSDFDLELVTFINNFFLDRINKQVIVSAYECGLVMLLPTSIVKEQKLLDELYFNLQKKFSSLPFILGIGRPASFGEYKRSFSEAKHAAKIGSVVKPNQKVFRFEQLGVYRILPTENFEEIKKIYEDYLEPIISFDKENKTELANTLKLFLANSCNYCATAKQLFLHPNTIRYRIQLIEEVCGVNLKSEEDRLCISLALKIAPFLN